MTLRSTLAATVALLSLSLAGAGCEKKPVPVTFEAGPPPAPVATTPTPIDVIDAGAEIPDAAPDAAKGAPAVNVNHQRALRCCRALKDAAATAPELVALSTTCQQIANAMSGGKGTPTELEPLRQLLRGKKVPDLCAGL